MNSRSFLLMAMCAFLSLSAQADWSTPAEYVWTGAQNAYWTNAANWTVGGVVATDVPGRYFTAAGEVSNLNAVAVFDQTGSERTTINLAGHNCVSSVVIRAGAPAYTFGVSGNNNVGLYFGLSHDGGRFVVEAGAKAPTLQGVCGLIWTPDKADGTMNSTSLNTYGQPNEAKYLNYSDEALVLKNFGQRRGNGFPSGTYYGYYRFIGLGGTGSIKIDGWTRNQNYVALNLYPENGAKLLMAGTTQNEWASTVLRGLWIGGGRQGSVEVCSHLLRMGVGVETREGGYGKKNGFCVVNDANSSLTISTSGTGRLGFEGSSKDGQWGTGYIRTTVDVAAGARLTFDGDIVSTEKTSESDKRPADPRDGLYFHRGSGTVVFTERTTNAVEGGLDLTSNNGDGATVSFVQTGAFGTGPVRIGRAGRLSYMGSDSLTFSLPIVLTNKALNVLYEDTATIVPSAVFQQAGSGALTVASTLDVVSGASGQAALTLANDTAAPATWSGVLKDSSDGLDKGRLQVTKTGSGTWTLSAANTYSGATTVSGGTLALAAGGSLASSAVTLADKTTLSLADSQTLSALTFNGTAKLVLGANVTLDVTAYTQGSGAALQVWASEGAKVRFAGVTGSVPSWLTVYSARGLQVGATIDANGYISEDATVWQGAAADSWTEAANWTAGLPSATKRAIVRGASDVVEVSSGTTPTAGAVLLEAGTLNVKGTLTATVPTTGERFVVKSAVQVTDGGTLTVANAGGVEYPALEMEGGSISVGQGTLDVKSSTGITGTGKVTVNTAQDGKMTVMGGNEKYTRFGTGASTGTLALNIEKQSLYGAASGNVDFGYEQAGTLTLTVVAGKQDSIFSGSGPRCVCFGKGKGLSVATLAGGSLQGGNWGTKIAIATADDSAVTGRVSLVGGRLFASSGYLDGGWSGLAVGLATAATTPAAVRGEVELGANGKIEVGGVSPFGLGIGGAEGYCLQTDGVFSMNSVAGAAVLGYGSGTGEYVISNGTFSLSRPFYVGGCLRADLELKTGTSGNPILYGEGTTHTAGCQRATGRFYARGGSVNVTAAKGIIVGADGKGRFEIGPSGCVTSTVVAVSNNVEGVLAYELGARGAGRLTATKLIIAEGAKLEIDATALSADSRSTICLATCDELEGAFDADHIKITYPPEQTERFAEAQIVTQRGSQKGLWLKLPGKGLMLIVR